MELTKDEKGNTITMKQRVEMSRKGQDEKANFNSENKIIKKENLENETNLPANIKSGFKIRKSSTKGKNNTVFIIIIAYNGK